MLLNLTSNGVKKVRRREEKHRKAATGLGELVIPHVTRSAFLPLNLGF